MLLAKEVKSETCLVVQWLRFHFPMKCMWDSVPGWAAKIPHASCSKNKNLNQKQYCNKFSKDLKKKKKKKRGQRWKIEISNDEFNILSDLKFCY